VTNSSIPAVLRERASLQPTDTAFTFMDYGRDPAGVAETLTWSQVYRRTMVVAQALRECTSEGDRALILAPQGLDYIAAFLGALQAGLIAVPLTIPFGPDDEHVRSVLSDSAPSVILTTALVVDVVATYAQPRSGQSAPSVIEIDSLDLDSAKHLDAQNDRSASTAYLQYTSGSTREPAGVVVSHRNLVANFEHVMSDYFEDFGKVAPPDTTVVSWVPLSHNMGLFVGVCAPILGGLHSVLMSPIAFIQKPARWMQLLAGNSRAFSPAPNFALELAAQATSDDDMAGLDLGNVLHIICGGERVQASTLSHFTERFARSNLSATAIRPSYGLAEATVYVATRKPGDPPEVVSFESEALSTGHAKRRGSAGGTELVSYGVPNSPTVRIVDPETTIECPAEKVGEIWVHGDNIATGYWNKPQETQETFGAMLASPSAGTPEGPWLRTGDLGAISDGELFIMGRIKDVLIVYGRNHFPDDIEATIQQVTGGRAAAIAVPGDRTEELVAIIELEKQGDTDEDAMHKLDIVKGEITSAVSTSHGLGVADLVPVAPGSIPLTRSGKVRRAICVERYRDDQFARLDVEARSL
jgi:long-chain fatty acid adenylyltransferase FadD28